LKICLQDGSAQQDVGGRGGGKFFAGGHGGIVYVEDDPHKPFF